MLQPSGYRCRCAHTPRRLNFTVRSWSLQNIKVRFLIVCLIIQLAIRSDCHCHWMMAWKTVQNWGISLMELGSRISYQKRRRRRRGERRSLLRAFVFYLPYIYHTCELRCFTLHIRRPENWRAFRTKVASASDAASNQRPRNTQTHSIAKAQGATDSRLISRDLQGQKIASERKR